MYQQNSSLKLVVAALLFTCVFLLPGDVTAQSQEQIRAQAIALFDADNYVAALPLLEKAYLTDPRDTAIASRLGFALYAVGTTSEDKSVRQRNWERARKILLKSQANGDDSN